MKEELLTLGIRCSADEAAALRALRVRLQADTRYGSVSLRDAFRFAVQTASAAIDHQYVAAPAPGLLRPAYGVRIEGDRMTPFPLAESTEDPT